MSKITLTDLVNLQNETTAVNAINANNATIETAFDNTLSRDGTQPNAMGASLDMNSNRILNLPAPSSSNESARLIDVSNIVGGPVTFNNLPTGGTVNQVLAKNSSTDYDASWSTIGKVPVGGTTAQALTKNTATNFDTGWTTIPPLTSGGTVGQVLTKNSSTNFDASWATPSVSSVTSIAGNGGAFTLSGGITNTVNAIKLSLTNASLQTTATSPAGTTSVPGVMCGLGATCALTPTYSGRVKIQFTGSVSNSTTSDTTTASIRWGTGAAPANGAAATGTSVGGINSHTSASAGYLGPLALSAIITGLTPGTAYWFDLIQSVNGGTGTLISIAFDGFEF